MIGAKVLHALVGRGTQPLIESGLNIIVPRMWEVFGQILLRIVPMIPRRR